MITRMPFSIAVSHFWDFSLFSAFCGKCRNVKAIGFRDGTLARVLFFAWLALQSFLPASGQMTWAEKDEALRHLLEAHLSHEGKQPVHNFMLYAEHEPEGYVFHEGAGIVGRDDTPIDEDFQFNIASITKTFVAVVVLQLAEEGRIGLQDKAAAYLAAYDYLDMDEVHLYEGRSYGREITIEQLLRHTSGIADIFTDAQNKFYLSVLTHKKREYTIEDVVKRYFRYNLNKAALFKPGEGYHYSDMNYHFLGMIVESATGSTLPAQIRQRILEPLGMENSYFIYYEPPCGHGKRIDSYLNKINITRKINTSYEYGGGGLVSTTRELAVFIRALFKGKLFERESTLAAMTDFSETQKFGGEYGYGLSRYELGGEVLYGHGGFYGSLLLHEPGSGITLSVNAGQANVPFDAAQLVGEMLRIVGE